MRPYFEWHVVVILLIPWCSHLCYGDCEHIHIPSKDSHPLCIECLGVRHTQDVLANPECCPHCFHFSLRVLEHRVRVAVTTKGDLGFSAPPLDLDEVAPQHW